MPLTLSQLNKNTCNQPPSPFTQRRETESHLMAATSSRCLSMNDSLRGSCPTTIQTPSSHRSKLPRKWVTQLPWLVFAIVINLTAWTHMWNSPVNEDFKSDVWSLCLCTDIALECSSQINIGWPDSESILGLWKWVNGSRFDALDGWVKEEGVVIIM